MMALDRARRRRFAARFRAHFPFREGPTDASTGSKKVLIRDDLFEALRFIANPVQDRPKALLIHIVYNS